MITMKEKQVRRTMYMDAKMNEVKGPESQMQQRIFLKHRMFNLKQSPGRTCLYSWYIGTHSFPSLSWSLTLSVLWVHFYRDEIRFNNLPNYVAQISFLSTSNLPILSTLVDIYCH